MTVQVSVVVPTHRRDDLLRRCLAALAAQDLDPASYEIIVVDDAPSSCTRKLVESSEWRAAIDAGEESDLSPQSPSPRRGAQAALQGRGRSSLFPSPRGGAQAAPGGDGRGERSLPVGAGPGERASGSPIPGPALAREVLSWPWLEGAEPSDGQLDDAADVLLETHYVTRTTRDALGAPGANGQSVSAVLSPAHRRAAQVVVAAPALPAVRYIPRKTGPRGPAAARNLGWQAARGEIVAFTDDDCVPGPGWLAAGLAAFSPEVLGVSGRVLMPVAGMPTDYELNSTGLERSEFVTANSFYRRSALAAVGGFDVRFALPWREDSDLFFTLLERQGSESEPGAFFRQAADALVVHPIRPAPWGVSLGQQRKNMFNALLYKKHPRLYEDRLRANTPWHYYAIVGTLLAMPCAWLLEQQPTAAAAGILWLALTLRLASQRLQHTSPAPGHVIEIVITSALIPPLAVFWRLAGALKYRVRFL